jgi:predicted Zn-dependent protease
MKRDCFVVPLLAGLLAMTAGGCATLYNPATGRRETVLTTAVEETYGRLARTQMGLLSLRKGKVNDEEFKKIQAIGERLAQVSDRKAVRYQFGVIREKSLNAFTLPGGTIYIHTGILEKGTEDEVAAVLAHEVGHVAARHVAKHLQADLGFSAVLAVAQVAGMKVNSARVMKSIYTRLNKGFSRQDELEADRLALRYAKRAGYDPHALISFFEKMLEAHPEGPAQRARVWDMTHPLTTARIAKAKEELATLEGTAGAAGSPAAQPPAQQTTGQSQPPAAPVAAQAGKFCPECGRVYSEPKAKFCERDGTPLKNAAIGNQR